MTDTATACEWHDRAGECTEECARLANLMRGDDYAEPMVYGDYLGGESTIDFSGCHRQPETMINVAVLDAERRAVVWQEVCPYEDEHDAMPCEVCSYLGE